MSHLSTSGTPSYASPSSAQLPTLESGRESLQKTQLTLWNALSVRANKHLLFIITLTIYYCSMIIWSHFVISFYSTQTCSIYFYLNHFFLHVISPPSLLNFVENLWNLLRNLPFFVRVISGGRLPLQRTTVEQEIDAQNNGNNDLKNHHFSPTEMRLRMISELQKREEIFSCEMELQQLEQSHAMQSANQVMQQYVMQNEVDNRDFLIALPSQSNLFIFKFSTSASSIFTNRSSET